MSTGYALSPGYSSGYSGTHSKGDAWVALKRVVADLRERPDWIVAEVLRVEFAQAARINREVLNEYAEAYALDQDLTIKIVEKPDESHILQMARGGGDSRTIKELMRRAFCRLVIAQMHERGMEVNLHVT